MTPEEREQVVELLRRGAVHTGGIHGAMIEKYSDQSIIGAALASMAIDARFEAGSAHDESLSYGETCRIAAQRVDEGWSP